MSAKRMRTFEQVREYWRWRVLPAIALLAFSLGVVGFWSSTDCHLVWWKRVLQASVLSLQMFLLNAPADGMTNPAAYIGYWLAIPVFFGLALVLIGQRFLDWSRRRWLRFRPAADIVIGGSEEAASLLRVLSEHRKAVAVTTVGQPLDACDAQAVIEIGALEVSQLPDIGWRQAKRIWVSTGNDAHNVILALQLREELAKSDASAQPPRVLASASGSQPGRLDVGLMTAKPSADAHRVLTELYSLNRLAARELFRRHLRASGGGVPHVAILGCTALSRALVVHAAQHCVFSESLDETVRVTFFGRGAKACAHQLQQEYPALSAAKGDAAFNGLAPFLRWQVHDCDERNIPLSLWRQAQADEAFTVVIVACEHDADTLVAADHCVSLREVVATPDRGNHQIVGCRQQVLARRGALPEIVFGQGGVARHWQWFDLHRECLFTASEYPGAEQDHRAQLIRLASSQFAKGEVTLSKDLAAELWRRDQSDSFRWSDRLAADHVDVKLDVLARWARDRQSPVAGDLANWRASRDGDRREVQRILDVVQETFREAGVVEMLARIEHRRFVAERMIGGWLPLPSERVGNGICGLSAKEQRQRLLVSHTLVPYDDLPGVDSSVSQQGKDENIVTVIPRILIEEAR